VLHELIEARCSLAAQPDGPDQRTQITESTRNVVFTVYIPAGIDEPLITQHLEDMRDCVNVIAPQAQVELLSVYG
jgi:DNA/RNA-binding domain of Phe-tRNA-synthetase-like protein